jgi:hypothetical protein
MNGYLSKSDDARVAYVRGAKTSQLKYAVNTVQYSYMACHECPKSSIG